MLLEIGTGISYEAGVNIFGVTYFAWSSDGRFIFIGTAEGRIAICECQKEIKENIWDVLSEMKKSVFYWDQWTLGKKSIFDENNYSRKQRRTSDLELTKILKSTPQSLFSEPSSYSQSQSYRESVPLMVHANPYFKYGKAGRRKKEKRFRVPKRRKIKKGREKEGSVLFLNKGGKKLSYRDEIEKAKRVLRAAHRVPVNRDGYLLKKSNLQNILKSKNFGEFYKNEVMPETRKMRELRLKSQLEEKKVQFGKKKMRRYASQGTMRNSSNQGFKIKKNVIKLYPRKFGDKKTNLKKNKNPNKKFELHRMSQLDNRAKLLYGIHTDRRFKPKRSVYKDRIQNYGYSSIPKVDSSMRFNSLIVPHKDDESEIQKEYSFSNFF